MGARYSHLTGEPIIYPFANNGQKIREARKLTGLTQQKFAGKVGTTPRHLIRLENGEHLPTPELRDRIAKESGTEEEIEARRMGRPSDDDEEEDLSLLTVLHNPSLDTVLWLRATAKRRLRDADEIEKHLAGSA